jgi:PAS domain S-box-containing protein
MHDLIHHTHADGSHCDVNNCRIFQTTRHGIETHVDDELFWRADGTSFTAEYWSFPIYKNGDIVGAVVTFLDITQRKQAEEALKLERDSTRNILATVEAMIVALDSEGRIMLVNRKACEILGYREDELLGQDWFATCLPHSIDIDQIREVYKMVKVCNLPGSEYYENPVRTGSGEERLIAWHNSSIRDKDGNIIGGLSAGEDITERKQAEEEKHALEQQFQQTQKLESLGVLAGGIAHDFNNILAIIMGYCSLTKMDYEDAEKHIPEIEKAAERAAALCRQMLTYAGKATAAKEQVNTWMLVDEMDTMLKTTIQKNVVIKAELGNDIPFIMGDASQLRQVVMNLIINAAEAIGDAEGEIDVKLVKTEIKAEQAEKDHLGVIIAAGRYILFEVTDNGCGMDDDTKRKIFEPFYTTKFTGRGLGMSAVLGIIKAHNGALQLESHKGEGTTFKVYLPVQISTSETEEAQQKAASAPWRGSGTILLAEDEEHIREIAIILLQELGFTVLDAENGKEALELYQQNAADITLVITDMGMPVMNGYELFYKLKQLDPHLPIIVSSGFGEGDIGSKITREEIAGLINKPYKFEHLREVLRGVVEGMK